ncbi:MAG: response regulator [Chloroflexota bacterium]
MFGQHEPRNSYPLNAIIGLTDLMLDTPLNTEQKDFLETIRGSGDGLLGIINNILDFSKIEAGRLEPENIPFNLRECVEGAIDLMVAPAFDKGLELAYLIEESVPQLISGDVIRLRQILVNLLSNAVKFTSQGEIFLSVTVQSQHAQTCELRFAVVDTGIGIPQDRLHRLFQSFSQVDSSTTRQFGGTGLGLAISKRLAEAMGGQMWVESVRNEGSTFNFTIVAEPLVEADALAELSAPLLAGKRVLVIDDHPVNRLILKHHFVQWQVVSHLVDSGSAALALLAKDNHFDMVIMDMPLSPVDGLSLAHLLKQKMASPCPLVLLSSFGKLASPEAETLFAWQINKPVKPHILQQALLQVCRESKQKERLVETAVPTPMTPHPPPHPACRRQHHQPKVALHMLERLGYTAQVAQNGQEVLAALQHQLFDIILMDVQMPEMDGLLATQRIRQNEALPNQPHIIALTANALKGDRERFLAAGMNDYLSKPVRLEDLAAAIENYHPAANPP